MGSNPSQSLYSLSDPPNGQNQISNHQPCNCQSVVAADQTFNGQSTNYVTNQRPPFLPPTEMGSIMQNRSIEIGSSMQTQPTEIGSMQTQQPIEIGSMQTQIHDQQSNHAIDINQPNVLFTKQCLVNSFTQNNANLLDFNTVGNAIKSCALVNGHINGMPTNIQQFTEHFVGVTQSTDGNSMCVNYTVLFWVIVVIIIIVLFF